MTPAERDAPWPSFDQPAETYRDAFCSVWDDAYTRCERDPRGTRIVHCRAMTEQTCERKPIVCHEILPTAARVCLVADDECNLSSLSNGAATSVFCRAPKDGTPPPRRGWSCKVPRRAAYHDEDEPVRDDLAGHWWLVTPRGDTCLVTLNSINGLWASAPCSPEVLSHLSLELEDFDSWNGTGTTCSYAAEKDRLSITCPKPYHDRKTARPPRTLTFSIRDVDGPIGIGAAKHWRLLRISTLF